MDNLTVIKIISWATPFFILSVFAFIGWMVKQKICQVDALDGVVLIHGTRIQQLEESAVTSEQVRSIIHQSNEPMKATLQSLETTISQQTQTMQIVLQEIAERRGYDRAKREVDNVGK